MDKQTSLTIPFSGTLIISQHPKSSRGVQWPGEEWRAGTKRATFEPDDGRRGQLWIRAAFVPTTGQATFVLSLDRDSAAHIQLLEKALSEFPAQRWLCVTRHMQGP